MAQDIVGGLFGIQQQPNYYAEDQRAAVDIANLQSPKAIGRYYGAMIGAPLGRAVAQGVGSLLGVQDPRLQQASVLREAQQQGFDVTTPEGLQQLAQFFVQRGQPGLASQVAQQAQTMSRSAAEEQYKLAQAQAALREKKGTPQSQAEQVLLNQLQAQYGEVEGARRFYQMQQEAGERKAKAGAIQLPGQVKVPDIGTFRGDVRATLKPLDDQFKSAQFALQQVDAIRKGNMKAVPQLDRALATLVGDKQLGQAEVAMLANAGSFPDRVVAGYQKFVTGGPTAMSLDEKAAIIEAAQNQVAMNYNKERENLINVWSTANLPSQTVIAGIGDPKVSSLMQKQQQKQDRRDGMGMTQAQPKPAQMPKFVVGQKFTSPDGTTYTRNAKGTWDKDR